MTPFGAGNDSLIGRAVARKELRESLESDLVNGAVIVADAGMGKSALVRHVVRNPADGTLPLWIQGSPVLKAVPFGAMAPHLFLEASPDSLSALTVLRGFREFLEVSERIMASGRWWLLMTRSILTRTPHCSSPS